MSPRKWMFVLRGNGESHQAWGDRMRNEVSPELLNLAPSRLQLTVTEAPPPKLTLFPFKPEPIAIFNVYDEAEDPSRFLDVLQKAASSVSGYEVEESYPVTYDRAWSDGEPTPSPILLTMLRRKAGLSRDEFIRRWCDGHTPLSLEIHPLWYYQRNIVCGSVTDRADEQDGIVLEACPTRSDLLNPARFFGGPLKMLPNMLRVAKDISGFLDMRKTETFYATEYHIRS
ncbi:MAG: hypothetical protein JRG93_11955 [Deltaproteobacteria bacterium]|nr:hypothetical protein [Deltaproteobacteria bacterium]MBW2225470.1 hypothetical protein [Deltaproteobacteria bacterium]MBW2548114.1 hypothetical protein [Deltaproteobacteria bacterium]